MFCSKCGCQLSDNSNYCDQCGFKANDTSIYSKRNLTIIRQLSWGFAISFNILINDKICDLINTNQSKSYSIPDGVVKIQLTAKPPLTSVIESNVVFIDEADENVCLKITMKAGVWKNKLFLEKLN